MDNSSKLPQPGELIINNDYLEKNSEEIKEVKIIEWNIERGMVIDGILKELENLKADILLIQEIDIDCERSKRINCLKMIAEKLKMSYAYVSEFCELYDEVRKEKDQGGGVHGNAIFSKFFIDEKNTIAVKHKYQPVDWVKEGYSRREPRKGDRYFISSILQVAKNVYIDVYSIHLEVFCGITGRIQQFSDVPLYAENRRKSFSNKDDKLIQVIGGDLNTMAHGVARFSPKYCGNDWMRFATIGKSEGKWWLDNSFCGGDQAVNNLKSWGFTEDVYENYKYFEGFKDPWEVDIDFTHQDWIWYFGKLDWLFIRGGNLVNKFIGNHDFSLSDHKYLGIVVKIN
jgi:endonuclease/exonuclease/phosphatase family metal-dependent hydrolase